MVWSLRGSALSPEGGQGDASSAVTCRRALVAFDVGGTLIDDPFEQALSLVSAALAVSEAWSPWPRALAELFEAWRRVNRTRDHLFCSHFLQEEVWVQEALASVVAGLSERSDGIQSHDLALEAPRLLLLYRAAVRDVVRDQDDLEDLRKLLVALRGTGTTVVAASNDRAWATPALLWWAQLEFDAIYTSEGFSRDMPSVEKPDPTFFEVLADQEAAREGRSPRWTRKIYVGDSEQKDIVPARMQGFSTVLFSPGVELHAPEAAAAVTRSAADVVVRRRVDLLGAVRALLDAGG